jgi:hypothetical protein
MAIRRRRLDPRVARAAKKRPASVIFKRGVRATVESRIFPVAKPRRFQSRVRTRVVPPATGRHCPTETAGDA